MNALPASADKVDQLAARMQRLGIRESDLEETFVRSAGHGGQNVNKTSTCVMLLHRPSGVQVKCQDTRQQGMNRVLARRLLLDKIESLRQTKIAADKAALEKARRQKRPRSRRSKQRMLADKARHSAKKQLRGRPQPD
jgi:peptide chain release factor